MMIYLLKIRSNIDRLAAIMEENTPTEEELMEYMMKIQE